MENSWNRHELNSQPRPQTQTSSCSQGKLDMYKCSQCNQVFGKPAALKRHFKVNHREPHIKDSFTCFEQGCQFSSSSANRQEYQSHLTSKHGLDLIPCTSPSCTWAFPTREEMEGHRESHLPFGCFCCPFVAKSAKALRDHLVDCNRLYNNPEGTQNRYTNSFSFLLIEYVENCVRILPSFLGSQTKSTPTPKGPKRSKRKLESPSVSSSLHDGHVLERKKSNNKRLRITVEKDKSSAPDAAPLPSKGNE